MPSAANAAPAWVKFGSTSSLTRNQTFPPTRRVFVPISHAERSKKSIRPISPKPGENCSRLMLECRKLV